MAVEWVQASAAEWAEVVPAMETAVIGSREVNCLTA